MAKKIKKKRISHKNRILRFLEEIEWMFGINTHNRKIIFAKSDSEGKGAECYYQQDYQTVEITIYPCFFQEDLDSQRKMLLHELCHIITLPSKTIAYNLHDGQHCTKDELIKINEEATSKIENIVHNLLKGNLKYAKTAYKNYLK